MTARLLTIAIVALAVLAVTGIAAADIVSVSPAQAKTNEPLTVVVEAVEGDSCLAFEPASLDYITSDGPQPCGSGSWSVTIVVGTVPESGTMAIVEQVAGVEVNRLEIGVVEGSADSTSATTTTTNGDTTTTTTTTTTPEDTTTTAATTTTTSPTSPTSPTTSTAISSTTTEAPPAEAAQPGDDQGTDFPGGPLIPILLVVVGVVLMIWGGVFHVFRR